MTAQEIKSESQKFLENVPKDVLQEILELLKKD